jgi:hypothetical protein
MSTLVFLLMFMSSLHAQSRRIVYIFGSGEQEAQVAQQYKLFQERGPECRERDLDIIIVQKSVDPKRLYKHHGVHSDSFAVVLIGKDGTEKYRSDRVTQPDQIFRLIDSMPMRQHEVRQKSIRGDSN